MAERKNRSIVEAARAMLEEKSLPKFYWAKAVRTAVYIQNRIGEKVSVHELYFGRKPNLRHCKFVSTPLDRTVNLHPNSGKLCDPTRFQQIVGSLIYLTITRPDISYPVGVISQFMV